MKEKILLRHLLKFNSQQAFHFKWVTLYHHGDSSKFSWNHQLFSNEGTPQNLQLHQTDNHFPVENT